MMKRILFCILLLMSCILRAQTFHHLNEDYSLTQQSIVAITQDSKGFIWLGGRYGLSRYDGEHYKVFKSRKDDSTSLPTDAITALLCDSQHTLWVGTSRGLNKYDAEKEIFKRVLFPFTKNEYINALYEDRQGTLWVSTPLHLYRFQNNHHNQFTAVTIAPCDTGMVKNVRCFFEDSRANLWLGCASGVVRIEAISSGFKFKKYPCNLGQVNALWENPKSPGTLWVGTSTEGLFTFDMKSGIFYEKANTKTARSRLTDNFVRALCQDSQGRLWIGTRGGIEIFDEASGHFSICQHEAGDNNSLSQNSVHTIFRDAKGSVWVGTYFGGANVVYAHASDFKTYANNNVHSSISSDVITSIVEDASHNLWIGTDGGGLNYFDRTGDKFISYEHNESDRGSIGSSLVKVVLIDTDGNVWAGTHGGGLNVLESHRFKKYLYKENEQLKETTEVESILEDKSGRFWVGSEDGLNVFIRKGRELLPYFGPLNIKNTQHLRSIHLLFEDSKSNIWMVASGILYFLKAGEKNFSSWTPLSDSHITSKVNCIREDHKGHIWFGTNGEGILEFDPVTGRLVTHGQNEGLLDLYIMSIEEDNDGRIWAGTSSSLSCLDLQKNTFRNYTAADGLPLGGFNYSGSLKLSTGELFFGGFNGLVSFVPANITYNTLANPPVLTSLDLFNKPIVIGGNDKILEKALDYVDELHLNHDQNAFTLHFALLNFIKPEKNRYAYQLTGFDKDWNEVAMTSATYAGLPPGEYTFKVKAANNDGVWSQPATLRITIRPPFWNTWWAYLLYFTAALGLLFLFIRFLILRALLKQTNTFHQAKLNFFTNISHEIRTHLALISGPIEKMMLRQRDVEDQHLLRYIKKNSESLVQLVGELLDFRKAESGHLKLRLSCNNIVPFVQDIFQTFEHTAIIRNIKTELSSSSDAIWVNFDGEQIHKAIVNLLSNAFKFTPDNGCIGVKIIENKGSVEISVTDNGKGIAPENLPKLFTNYYQEQDYGVRNTGYGIGLAFSKTIVELHKGLLKVESQPGIRTCFTVILPKGAIDAPKLIAPQPMDKKVHKPDELFTIPGPSDEKQFSVLVVEDNPELRSFLRSSLEDQYEVIEATDGLEGWDVAINEIPDVIISDVMMPRLDGFTLCGKLKTDPRTSHIPTILLTAKNTTPEQISGLEMGADIYMAKPFSIHILNLHLRNLLSLRELLRRRYTLDVSVHRSNEETKSLDDEFMKKASAFIEEKMDSPDFGVQMLTSHMLMSQPVLYKKIKALTDMSVNDFIKNIRLKKAARLLLENRYTVYEVIYMVGYNDRKHFTQEFKKMFGVTPGEYANEIKE